MIANSLSPTAIASVYTSKRLGNSRCPVRRGSRRCVPQPVPHEGVYPREGKGIPAPLRAHILRLVVHYEIRHRVHDPIHLLAKEIRIHHVRHYGFDGGVDDGLPGVPVCQLPAISGVLESEDVRLS